MVYFRLLQPKRKTKGYYVPKSKHSFTEKINNLSDQADLPKSSYLSKFRNFSTYLLLIKKKTRIKIK